MTAADPKAAEREAAASAFMSANNLCELWYAASVRGALAALLATRERDAAVGAVGALRALDLKAESIEHEYRNDGQTAQVRAVSRVRMTIYADRLALEQGTPATCASCGKPMEGERFTIKASVRADLVGKTVGRCCWPPDHGAEGYGEGTPATREETP